MAGYAVIEFINEKSVAAVPYSWFNCKTNKCAWPKSNKHTNKSITKFLEKKEPYNSNDFDLYDARLFKKDISMLWI